MKFLSVRGFSFLCTFLMFSICLPSTIVQAEPVANFKDIENHWAVRQISDWLNKDLVGGYTDGTFKPDNSITRAEFIALVNRAFGFTETVPVAFSDVRESDWYALEVAKASAIGYIAGYPDGSFKPNNSISRQEAAAILAKCLNPKQHKTSLLNLLITPISQIGAGPPLMRLSDRDIWVDILTIHLKP